MVVIVGRCWPNLDQCWPILGQDWPEGDGVRPNIGQVWPGEGQILAMSAEVATILQKIDLHPQNLHGIRSGTLIVQKSKEDPTLSNPRCLPPRDA